MLISGAKKSINSIKPVDVAPEDIAVLEFDLFGLKKAKVEHTGK